MSRSQSVLQDTAEPYASVGLVRVHAIAQAIDGRKQRNATLKTSKNPLAKWESRAAEDEKKRRVRDAVRKILLTSNFARSVTRSFARAVTKNNCSSVEASAPKIERTAYLPNKSSDPPASDPPASSYSLRRFFNSAAKPAASEFRTSLIGGSQPIVSTLCDMIQKINNVAPKNQGNDLGTAQMLLDDIPVLQRWNSAKKPSNEVRDAMLKLGSRWNVQRSEQGKKRAPAEVSKDLEARMHQIFNELLSKHDARIDKHASQPNKYRKLDFASEPSASSCSKQLSASESGTSLSTVAQPNVFILCDVIQEVNHVAPKLQGNELETAQRIASTLLCMMQKLNKVKSRDESVEKLVSEMRILQQFKQMRKPTNKDRARIRKLCPSWGVP